ncbi:5-bromo-4-chloroindolyl phosphate hydrolysis family protein [Lawsonibacter sp. OA9]|uniref:5-bromo-4-chloroindolyl phosphate hydrolysis family protein n=1 Tax=Lawsonibacter sp. OA9 TaxID=2914163 RepID=UPI001F051190|nr:5-bromo-4-chloroindolyl phosphate hydrolysis family protein [Lawsonibacter sp. OA9]MCH1980397.1 5-bromo-4-chloroindolyl phosphate hydrolysis family protein [Lawsonibacter sp. OA9]
MANTNKGNERSGDMAYWAIAAVLLFTGVAAPVAILMIVLKLMGRGKRGRHPYYTQRDQAAPVGARTTTFQEEPSTSKGKGRKKAKAQQDLLSKLAKDGKRLTQVGGALAICFGMITLINGVENLWMLPDISWYLSGILVPLCFACGGLGCLWAGVRKNKEVRRYRNYLAVIGTRQSIAISTLASASGLPPRRVRDDLADMLGEGILPQGFLDYGGDRLVLSADGLSDSQPKEEAPSQPLHQEENAILTEIRAVNEAVDNEKLSAQIDRIGVITAKILDYQKSHPESSPQLHSFLSYYLPTTLKILRAYGQLEDQEVSGENIAAAMERIEGMMDKVVDGFEKQLDLLFQGDAMDITADVEVLERMLAKDGLSGQEGMTLGL